MKQFRRCRVYGFSRLQILTTMMAKRWAWIVRRTFLHDERRRSFDRQEKFSNPVSLRRKFRHAQ